MTNAVRSCGSCKWWGRAKLTAYQSRHTDRSWAPCEYPRSRLPFWVPFDYDGQDIVSMRGKDGKFCETFKAMEAK